MFLDKILNLFSNPPPGSIHLAEAGGYRTSALPDPIPLPPVQQASITQLLFPPDVVVHDVTSQSFKVTCPRAQALPTTLFGDREHLPWMRVPPGQHEYHLLENGSFALHFCLVETTAFEIDPRFFNGINPPPISGGLTLFRGESVEVKPFEEYPLRDTIVDRSSVIHKGSGFFFDHNAWLYYNDNTRSEKTTIGNLSLIQCRRRHCRISGFFEKDQIFCDQIFPKGSYFTMGMFNNDWKIILSQPMVINGFKLGIGSCVEGQAERMNALWTTTDLNSTNQISIGQGTSLIDSSVLDEPYRRRFVEIDPETLGVTSIY